MPTAIEHLDYFTSLPRSYYVSQEIYDEELQKLFYRQWLYAGHVSQVRAPGDFFSRSIGPESLIFTRDHELRLKAFYNVCRHRGAQLCTTGTAGTASRLVCPYHNWTYGMNGQLQGVPGSPDTTTLNYSDWPLHEAYCDIFHGGIWVWLGNPDEAPPLADTLGPSVSNIELLRRMEPERTKIACQKEYIVKANWKLLLENNCECYHCPGAHQSLSATCDYSGFYTTSQHDTGGNQRHFPLRKGMKSFSMDGEWVSSKPLGAGFVPDLSVGYLNIPFFTGPVYFADHAVSLDIAPIDKDTTRLVSQWFVHEDAVEDVDYSIKTLTEIFDITNKEDCGLAELNQRGVNSHRFVPGPNNPVREALIKTALNQYLELMKPS
ncbi:aromatic ring-hydroxylating oxygenase subunit alpha [Rhodococcus sp. NBC_00297]|uniref:aromatic ring-hydroxylating oxygenase subunit alpha n=1 Tax=Rhodococcus sp. NBC_00297 TaxID=2976005 RepID=UPI002E27B18A|nr:aromatic ring-hydroxylating dioxygenase subunit alpha [Rhodococcus sp. NBC_00297]